ncbi:urease accessory protein UreF [Rathayibacter sp. Leaf296]|uniref:urease accessory protein UreF n=1 Tax=Rathayibacter sp. Leaf296 TaxID=1736327 RepID=UPI0007030ADF|nr:urease accessory UreF family protein [Rathayibacter sp. Leaf296]KQQ08245.1 hypothetical protein ASF46_13010 [Rathayibacter sp. Leaf296]
MTIVSDAQRSSSAVMAMLFADSRLPTGGHTQSAGLEPALLGGLAPEDVPEWIAVRLRTTALTDAGAAVVSRHLSLLGADAAALQRVVGAWAARTPSAAQRAASRTLGRGVQRLALSIWGEHAAVLTCRRLSSPPRCVVLGAVAAATGMAAEDLARVIVYDEAQSAATAMVKLHPTDPVDAVRWVLAAVTAVLPLVADVADLTDPEGIPALGGPLNEAWAEAHASRSQRLFHA